MIKWFFLSLLCFSSVHILAEEEPVVNDRKWLGYTGHLTEEEIVWLEETYRRLDAEEAAELKRCIEAGECEDDEDWS